MTGEELREFRQQAKLTRAEMGQLIGLSLRQYATLEADPDRSLRHIHRLAAERASLKIAVERSSLDLAVPSIRKDVQKYARMLEGA
jgi:transcriptional regulator with XRE-family HTH domain